MVSATTVLNWNHVTTSWALLGVFEEDYIGFPLSMIMLNFVAVLIAISVIESAFNTKACVSFCLFFFKKLAAGFRFAFKIQL